jgi:hypothetical protein
MRTSQQSINSKILCRASSRQRLIAGLVFLTIAGSFALFRLLDKYGVSVGLLFGPCGFKQRTGLPCPTCGWTTSAVEFMQGEVIQAFYLQPAAAFFCCTLVIVAILALLIAVFGVYFRFIERFFIEVRVRYIVLAVIIIILAGWAVTMSRALAAAG